MTFVSQINTNVKGFCVKIELLSEISKRSICLPLNAPTQSLMSVYWCIKGTLVTAGYIHGGYYYNSRGESVILHVADSMEIKLEFQVLLTAQMCQRCYNFPQYKPFLKWFR